MTYFVSHPERSEGSASRIRKFLAALLVLVLALAITFKMELFFGWSFDLIFAALVAFAALFGMAELIILVGLAVWIVQWQPVFAPELLVLLIVPVLVGVLQKLLPWRSTVTPAATLLLGILAFYAFARAPLGAHAWFLIGDILVSIACAYFILYVFRFTWGRKTVRRW